MGRKLGAPYWHRMCYNNIYGKQVSWAVLPTAVMRSLQKYMWGKSKQIKQLLRKSLVTGIVLYCKVLISCRNPTYVTISKWYFKLNILKTLLTHSHTYSKRLCLKTWYAMIIFCSLRALRLILLHNYNVSTFQFKIKQVWVK